MAELNTITDPNLPEPKNISTAPAGQFYVSNGLGSGNWKYVPEGWGNYEHSGAAEVFNTTPSKVIINSSGLNTNESYLPRQIRGSGSLWDSTNNLITPIGIGDSYHLRLTLPITSKTGGPNVADIQLDIGGAATPTNVIYTTQLSLGPTPPFTRSIGFPVFTLNTFVANGCQIFINVDSGSVDITNPSIFISRKSSGDL